MDNVRNNCITCELCTLFNINRDILQKMKHRTNRKPQLNWNQRGFVNAAKRGAATSTSGTTTTTAGSGNES